MHLSLAKRKTETRNLDLVLGIEPDFSDLKVLQKVSLLNRRHKASPSKSTTADKHNTQVASVIFLLKNLLCLVKLSSAAGTSSAFFSLQSR